MQAVLKIPFAQKEAAKAAARAAGGRLWWPDNPERTWMYEGPALPAELARYRQDVPDARTFVLDVPFELRAQAQDAGAAWQGTLRAWVWRGPELPEALRPYQSAPYSWERYREDDLNGGPLARHDAAVVGIVPRPHQVEAITAIHAAVRAGRTGFLLADDVGLGKTISAWEAVRRMPKATSVLVVCPLGVVAHWRDTIQALGDAGKRVVVLNYDRLARLFEAPDATPAATRERTTRRKGKRATATRKPRKVRRRTLNKRLAATGEVTAFDVVIFDESHKLRNLTSLRAKFATRVSAEARFVLWLSATAGQTPLELAYLAPVLAEVTGAKVKDLAAFESWCAEQGIGVTKGAFGKWIWDKEGPTAEADLEFVRRLLFTGRVPAGLRRRPEDIAGWPEVHRIPRPIALEPAARALYQQEWSAFRAALRLAHAPRAGARAKEHALVAQTRFRQKASLLRVEGTVALAEELLENGHQVAISVAWLESLEAMRVALEAAGHRCAVIHGDLTAAERERQRVAFQRGQRTVVIYTVEEAISLHAGDQLARGNAVTRSNIIHDPRYSAIQCGQIEGRCHRDGQRATVYYTYGEGTVEAGVVRTVVARLKSMKTMIGDDIETVRQVEAFLHESALRAA